MKLRILLLVLLAAASVSFGADFRYYNMSTTGMGNVVIDASGKETTILISETSDAEALAIIDALQADDICGTRSVDNGHGVPFDQHIILVGEFTSKVKRTKYSPHAAVVEPYRDFKITGIRVVFPFSRFPKPKSGELEGPYILETHFGFDTLFPTGIKVAGKPIDLTKHTVERKNAKCTHHNHAL